VPRAGLSPGAVVDAAIRLVAVSGPDKLTLAGVAAATGVAPPSLYRYIDSVDELFRLVAIRGCGR
jgi:AcrR family transcriptional regulator